MSWKKEYPKWIDGFSDAIYDLIRTHDPKTHMPFNGFNFYPLIDDLLIDKMHKIIKCFRKSKIKMTAIIDTLPTHSAMKFIFLEIIISLKTSKTSKYKARLITDFFLEVLRYRAINQNFWEDNKIHTYENVRDIIKKKGFIQANQTLSSEVAKIIAGCGSLVPGLYNDFCTDFGYDVFGPYDVSKKYGKGSSLFIRQFIDLKPIDIWPAFQTFPYKKILAYTVYKNVESESHYIGCHMFYKQSLVDNLSYFQIEVDGVFINTLDELKKIRENIFERTAAHYAQYKNAGFEEHKRLWLLQFFYQFQEFLGKLGLNWKPSKEMEKRVKEKELVRYITRYDLHPKEFSEKFALNYLKNTYS